MTIQQHASFDSSAAELNATSKLVKAWESKNAKNAAKAGGISLMALSLAACGGSSTTTTTSTGTTTTTTAAQNSNFTSNIDALVGGSGDDTFIGDSGTTSEADQVSGGDGSDTVKLYGGAALPTMTGIENLYIKGQAGDLDVSDVTGLTSVELDGFDLSAARAVNLTTGASLTVTDTTATANTITLSNNTTTAQTVNISGSGVSGTAVDFDLDGDAVATLNLVSGAKASFVDIDNTGASLATVNVSGAGDLTIENVEVATAINITSTGKTVVTSAVAKVAVTGAAGADTVTMSHATGTGREFSVSTGAGDDTISLGTMAAAADLTDSKVTVSGGDGTDTLAMTSALGAALSGLTAANYAKKGIVNDFETIQINNQAATTDALGLAIVGSNASTVDYAAGLGDAQTLTGLASGGTVVLGAAAGAGSDKLTVTVLDSAAAGAVSDTLNIRLDGAHAGAALDYGIIEAANVETINIISTSTKATALVAADKNTVDGIFANATTINISGNVYADIDGDVFDGVVQVIDASANTAGVAVNVNDTIAVKITGTAAVDAIVGGDGADVIDGGAGNDVIDGDAGDDTITGGAGDDVITGEAGDDTITLGDGADDVVLHALAAAGEAKDIVKDFVVGTDDIDVNFTMVDGAGANAAVTDYLDVAAGATTTTFSGNTSTAIFEFSAAADLLGEGVAGTFDATTATGAELLAAVIEQLATDVAVAQVGADTEHLIFAMYDEAGNAVIVNYTDAGVAGTDLIATGDHLEFVVLEDVAQGTLTAADFI